MIAVSLPIAASTGLGTYLPGSLEPAGSSAGGNDFSALFDLSVDQAVIETPDRGITNTDAQENPDEGALPETESEEATKDEAVCPPPMPQTNLQLPLPQGKAKAAANLPSAQALDASTTAAAITPQAAIADLQSLEPTGRSNGMPVQPVGNAAGPVEVELAPGPTPAAIKEFAVPVMPDAPLSAAGLAQGEKPAGALAHGFPVPPGAAPALAFSAQTAAATFNKAEVPRPAAIQDTASDPKSHKPGAAPASNPSPPQQTPGPAISSVEAAWRQKWINPSVPAAGDQLPALQATPDPVEGDADGAATKAVDPVPLGSPTIPVPQIAPKPSGAVSLPLPVDAAKGLSAPQPQQRIERPEAKGVEGPEASPPPAQPGIAPITGQPLDATLSMPAIFKPDGVPPPALASANTPNQTPPHSTPIATVAPTIVDMAIARRDGPVELALAPEELGRLTISIRHAGDFVHVNVTADRPDTLDLMRRHAAELVADLRQSGFSGASLNFAQSGGGGNPQFADVKPERTEGQAIGFFAEQSPTTRPGQSPVGAGLDLRF